MLANQSIHSFDHSVISVFEHQRLMAHDFVNAADFAWLLAQEFDIFSIKRQRGQWQLKVGHYIGIIILPSTMILEILPKPITTTEQNSNKRPSDKQNDIALTRHWVQQMLTDLMRASVSHNSKFPTIKHLGQISNQLAPLPIATASLSQWLLTQFLQLLAGYQPTQHYQMSTQNQALLQGKLLIKEQLRRNSSQPHKFISEVSNLSKDTLANRLIKSAIQLLKPLLLQPRFAAISSSKLLLAWRPITELTLYELRQLDTLYLTAKQQLSRQPLIHQQLQGAQQLLDWAYWLLKMQQANIQTGSSLSTHNGSTKKAAMAKTKQPRLCLLLNMNQAFEQWASLRITARFEQLNLSHQNCEEGQYQTHYQSRDVWLSDEDGQTCLSVQPDLLVRQMTASGHICSHVIDIKWKYLADATAISASDAYQLTSYAQAYQAKQVWLVYPVSDDSRQPVMLRQHNRSALESTMHIESDYAQLWLMPFNVLTASLNELSPAKCEV